MKAVCTYPPKSLRQNTVASAVTRLSVHFIGGLLSDLVICKSTEYYVVYDTECFYWNQALSNSHIMSYQCGLMLWLILTTLKNSEIQAYIVSLRVHHEHGISYHWTPVFHQWTPMFHQWTCNQKRYTECIMQIPLRSAYYMDIMLHLKKYIYHCQSTMSPVNIISPLMNTWYRINHIEYGGYVITMSLMSTMLPLTNTLIQHTGYWIQCMSTVSLISTMLPLTNTMLLKSPVTYG